MKTLNLGTLDNVRRSKEEYIEAEMLEKNNEKKMVPILTDGI